MATEKYNPNPINYGIIPKQWLNTPVMSSEEAFMELEKLQNAELANEINQQNAEVLTRNNESEKELAKEYEAKMQAKAEAGEQGLLSPEDALSMVRENQLKYGKGKELADDELRRLQIQSLDEERKRRAEDAKYRAFNTDDDIFKEGENGLELYRKGTPKPKSEGRPRWLINPNTLETEAFYGDEADEKEFGQGWISAGRGNADKLAEDLRWERKRSGKVDLNPTGGKQEEQKPVVDFKAPSGSKVLQKGDKLQIIYPNGKKETIDLRTNKKE